MAPPLDVPEPPVADRQRRARWGCLWLGLALVALPIVGVVVWWEVNTVITIDCVLHGDGWVAFRRRVDYAFPADADTSIWLGRSLDDRSTWHSLAATDSIRRDPTFFWDAPRVLRVHGSQRPEAETVRRVEDVTIVWR